MPSTAKDSLFESTTPEGTAKSETQGSQPSDAVGAEVPVTIHASRYSAAAKGAGKLPPVHEETRTVIIFPQGAVVRLAATVTPGELVVLTNNRTWNLLSGPWISGRKTPQLSVAMRWENRRSSPL